MRTLIAVLGTLAAAASCPSAIASVGDGPIPPSEEIASRPDAKAGDAAKAADGAADPVASSHKRGPGVPDEPKVAQGEEKSDQKVPKLDGKPEEPQVGRRVVVTPARGIVTILLPGTARAVGLPSVDDIPVGSVIDTRRGAVVLRSAVDDAGTEQAATFHGGRFEVRQGADGMVGLHLRGPRATCPRRGARARAATSGRRRRPPRRLWGSDDHGRFRTFGRDSVATVRGTRWLVEERCNGTLTRVVEGAVDVRDRRSGRVVRVRAGGRHFVPAGR